MAIIDRIKDYPDLWPTCMDYSKLLDAAQEKIGISRDKARDKYGLLTYSEWHTLLFES